MSPIASLSAASSSFSSLFFQIIISMTRLWPYHGFRGRQRRRVFYFSGGWGALKYFKGNGEQAKSFLGVLWRRELGKTFPGPGHLFFRERGVL